MITKKPLNSHQGQNSKMNLEEIEARLQSLIEVQLTGVLSGKNAEEAIVQKLVEAVKKNTIVKSDGSRLAPNVYTLAVAPDIAEHLQNPSSLDVFAEIIKIIAKDSELKFDRPPIVKVIKDASLLPNQANVLTTQQVEKNMEETQNISPDAEENAAEENAIPENSFLIIEGVKVFPLRTPVVNIGRRLDNTLVIDDPRVSRNHAQLRSIKGRYVIFDLNSTGGTFINGQRASQSVLYPGDVISLAGVALIFGQDNPPPRPDLATTSPFDSNSGERPTAILTTMPPAEKKKKE